MKISRAWLQKYFEKPLPTGTEIEDAFTFHAFEIEESFPVGEDTVIDVKVLPNRAADCLSHRGVAYELSAILNQKAIEDPFRKERPAYTESNALSVTIEDAKLCDRYIGAMITDVTVGPSPEWLKTALEAVGQRSINNVVDATNYVMLDLGQPLHAFDAARLSEKDGKFAIHVRSAKSGEKVTTLSGDEYTLTPETLLITDRNSDAPLGIAGIKGGKAAEITEATTDIIIESAHFNYASVRKTAQRLKLFTDASSRFQNNPSPVLAGYGMDAVIALVLEIAGGKLEGVVDVWNQKHEAQTPVSISLSKIGNVLGTSISGEVVRDAFSRLNLPFREDGEVFIVTPPFERTDLTIPEDLIEEVGRIYGYEHVEPIPLQKSATDPEIKKRYYYAEKIRSIATALGFDEVMTYAMWEPLSGDTKDNVEILNPIASDKAFLRSSLHDGLVWAGNSNLWKVDLLGLSDIRIFEIGSVFKQNKEYFEVAFGYWSPNKKVGTEKLDEVISKLEAEFGTPLGVSGEGNVRIFTLDDLIEKLPEPLEYTFPPINFDTSKYHPISQYPFVLRDIAVWVPESVSKEEVESLIKEKASGLLVRLTPFDEFKKEGRVSYAFRLVFQSMEKTLSDEEINTIMKEITNTLNAKENWQVR